MSCVFADKLYALQEAGIELMDFPAALNTSIPQLLNAYIFDYGDFHVYVEPAELWNVTLGKIHFYCCKEMPVVMPGMSESNFIFRTCISYDGLLPCMHFDKL